MTVRWVLGCTGLLVLLIGWQYLRTHDKLDHIHDDMKSVHTRMDRESKDALYGIERLRTAIAELRKDFLDWWRRQ